MGLFNATAFFTGVAKEGLSMFEKAETIADEGLENMKAAREEVNEEIKTMKDTYDKAIQIGDNVGGGAFAKYLFSTQDMSYLAGLANQTQETRTDELSALKRNFENLSEQDKARFSDGDFSKDVKADYDRKVEALKINNGLVNTNNLGVATANTLGGKVQAMVDRQYEPRRQAIIDTVSSGELKESKPIEGSYESIQTSAEDIAYLDMDLKTQRPFTAAFQSYMKDEFLDPILSGTKDQSAIDNQIKTAIKTALPTAFDIVQPDGTVVQDGKSVEDVLLQLRGDSQITLDTIREEILMEDYFNQRYRGGYGDGYLSNLKEGYSQLDPSTILQVFGSYDIPFEEKVRIAVTEGFMDEDTVRQGFAELGIQ